jgi:hypothetical protein
MQPENWLYRTDDIFISSAEQKDTENSISLKLFYTCKANFWISRTIFEYK